MLLRCLLRSLRNKTRLLINILIYRLQRHQQHQTPMAIGDKSAMASATSRLQSSNNRKNFSGLFYIHKNRNIVKSTTRLLPHCVIKIVFSGGFISGSILLGCISRILSIVCDCLILCIFWHSEIVIAMNALYDACAIEVLINFHLTYESQMCNQL